MWACSVAEGLLWLVDCGTGWLYWTTAMGRGVSGGATGWPCYFFGLSRQNFGKEHVCGCFVGFVLRMCLGDGSSAKSVAYTLIPPYVF